MEFSEKKIMIFEDEEDILSICKYILEEQGWQVLTYTDAQDVVKRVGEFKPAIIFMDNWIPDQGGIAATRQLKKTAELKNIPVVYFSANSDIKLLMEDAGADAFLAKPFDLADLIKVMIRFY